jgi:sporulation integral membrane protein YlbJ
LEIIFIPKLCIEAALLGVNLFIKKVFPSLFPFLVVTGVMMGYNGVEVYSKAFGKILCKPLRLPIQCTFALVVSILCGYPLGAKYSCELYEQGLIDLKTCQRLISIATNTSPLFAIGAVGISMLGSSYIGYLLLIANYISCFFMGLILPVHQYVPHNSQALVKKIEYKNIGSIIKDTIDSAIKTSLSVGGYVIIFCVITTIIKSNIIFDIAIKDISYLTHIDRNLLNGVILGLIEMTNGCYLISTTEVNMYIKVIIIGFFLGFSGFSIISQAHSFTYKHPLSMKKYIYRKILQGIIGASISALLYKLAPINVTTQTTSGMVSFDTNLIFIYTIIILLIPYFVFRVKKLFYAS